MAQQKKPIIEINIVSFISCPSYVIIVKKESVFAYNQNRYYSHD